MYQIWTIGAITLVAGLLGGWAGYLLDPASSGAANSASKAQALYRYLVLGVIAAACVPLFLTILQSDLVSKIFSPVKEDGREVVPYSQFLVFTGFCLVAAISARSFLDTVSKQVMRDAQQATQTANQAQVQAIEAQKKAEVASELAVDALDGSTAPSHPALTEAAQAIPADTAVPKIAPEEGRALQAMMKKTRRTAAGVAEELGISRARVAELLDELESKKLVEPTTSPNTGGQRWQITPLGVHTLRATGSG